jgi:hypothetical protein
MAAMIASTFCFGQKAPFKFGKIEPAELSVNTCPIDSGADAFVIGDYGRLYFNYVQEEGFQTVFERHLRVKILKNTAFDWADFSIPLYYSGSNEEKVESLKGNTFNLENGKVLVSQMEKSAIFKEEVNEHRRNVKFTLPNVKEGSVIEVSYKIYSDFYTIWDWNFQQTIPVLKSQYQVEIPEYFNYKNFQNGYEKVITENSVIPGSIILTSKSREGFHTSTTTYSSDKIDFQVRVAKYSLENAPAFHDEPYMKSRVNYITSMEFELKSVQMPHSMLKDYTSDWEHINRELLDSESFGKLISQGGTKEITDKFESITQPAEKATLLYEYVRDNFKWDGYNRLYSTKNIRKIIEDKSGNSSEINLLLVNLLKKANLKAYPVILSTRDNGMIIMEYPVLQKINYVLACVELDGKQILLDATDKYCSFGFIPDKCLNDKGRIIDEVAKGNIDLVSSQKYALNVAATLKITDNNEIIGNWAESRRGYSAYKTRTEIGNAKSLDEYFNDIQKANPGLQINKFSVVNQDSMNNDLKFNLDVTLTGKAEQAGDLLMINPMLYEQLEKNPFKYEKRNFPVDYSFGYSNTYILRIDIPQGYKIESLPKPINVGLPENAGKFSYLVDSKENYIQVMRKFTMNKIIFLPDEYSILKEFYNQMVNKEAEVIVLKKI